MKISPTLSAERSQTTVSGNMVNDYKALIDEMLHDGKNCGVCWFKSHNRCAADGSVYGYVCSLFIDEDVGLPENYVSFEGVGELKGQVDRI